MVSNGNSPEVIVSMTSFPAAIQYAEKAILSLLRGSVIPDRLILYLTFSQFEDEKNSGVFDPPAGAISGV